MADDDGFRSKQPRLGGTCISCVSFLAVQLFFFFFSLKFLTRVTINYFFNNSVILTETTFLVDSPINPVNCGCFQYIWFLNSEKQRSSNYYTIKVNFGFKFRAFITDKDEHFTEEFREYLSNVTIIKKMELLHRISYVCPNKQKQYFKK